MNAKEFVKRFGWLKAISVSNHFSGLFEYKARDGEILFSFQVNDLKQLVDAWELVAQYNSLNGAKVKLNNLHDESRFKPKLKKAIELVESVNE